MQSCAAHRPSEVVPLNLQQRTLRPVASCENLISRHHPERTGSWYPACSIGSAADRESWVERLGTQRIAELNRLVRELHAQLGPLLAALWTAKSRQLAAEGVDAVNASTFELARAGETYISAVTIFFEHHNAELDRLGFPAEACLNLSRQLINGFIESRTGDPPRPSAAALAAFPAEARLFFDPQTDVVPA